MRKWKKFIIGYLEVFGHVTTLRLEISRELKMFTTLKISEFVIRLKHQDRGQEDCLSLTVTLWALCVFGNICWDYKVFH